MGMLVNGTSYPLLIIHSNILCPLTTCCVPSFSNTDLSHLNCENNLCFTVHVMLLTQQLDGWCWETFAAPQGTRRAAAKASWGTAGIALQPTKTGTREMRSVARRGRQARPWVGKKACSSSRGTLLLVLGSLGEDVVLCRTTMAVLLRALVYVCVRVCVHVSEWNRKGAERGEMPPVWHVAEYVPHWVLMSTKAIWFGWDQCNITPSQTQIELANPSASAP